MVINITGFGSTPNSPQANLTATVEGIELRDMFAMAVLQGWYADGTRPPGTPYDMARIAYKQADAMLAMRKEGER